MAHEIRGKNNKSDQRITDKILTIPGISEAIRMVRRYAIKGAGKDAWVRNFVRRLPSKKADNFKLDEEMIDFDLVDYFLESLTGAAGPKIAELWDLSEKAGEKIAEIIYWGQSFPRIGSSLGAKGYLLPLVILANMNNPEDIRQLSSEEYELIRKNTQVVSRDGMLNDHLYLDVTYLPYDALHIAYRSVVFCRKWLGLEKQDLREGAPETYDVARAIRCAELSELGKPNKEIARELGFDVYIEDNPSGSYPLFRKYLKKGQQIRQRLSSLEQFLSDELDMLLEELE